MQHPPIRSQIASKTACLSNIASIQGTSIAAHDTIQYDLYKNDRFKLDQNALNMGYTTESMLYFNYHQSRAAPIMETKVHIVGEIFYIMVRQVNSFLAYNKFAEPTCIL